MQAEVLIEIKNKQLDKTFTYKIPSFLESKVQIGSVVLVPFGKQALEGYVLNIKEEDETLELKEIQSLKVEEPVLNEELLELGKFLKKETLCSLSSCYAAMLPKALKAKKGSEVSKKYLVYLKINKGQPFEKVSKIQQEILDLFQEKECILKKEAQQISISAVQTLLKKGILLEEKREISRFQYQGDEREEKKKLTLEQEQAVKKITDRFDQAKTMLLHGVTGSGKTEVYLQVIEQVLQMKKTALVLVPEISLTPQLIERFHKRFPNLIAVLHSHLSDGEKYDEWRKIVRGETPIVIGARSAVFAPLKNIGIIIMDEEHADSYKQENRPKYHALKVCEERSKTWNCPLVLGSATPSLNSMARALKHVYDYIPMNKRALGMELPIINLIDMSEEMKEHHSILSRELEYEIIERLSKKEQIVLLLNRRGHSTVITCSNCGFTYKCPHCEITLTYHKSSQNLRCHYCGYTKYIDKLCPNCHEDGLNYYGLGTEKLEEYLQEVFPTARIVRMDADTTQNKGKYEQITKEFYDQKYDILLGTQMVSKGLDFPNVTLVGILNADASLNIPDYKSNERSFSLLCQASGRAGRSTTKGSVLIQTFCPEHPILQCVKTHNYRAFFRYEMRLRKTLKYPPFYYLAQIKIKGRDYQSVSEEIRKAKSFLEKRIASESILLGPAPSNPFLVNGVYSFELLVKYRFDSSFLNALEELDQIYIGNPKITLDLDICY